MRADLMKQLASRVQFDVPQALLDREIDRRVEEFVRRLMEQQIDPMQTNINWEEFRERQRDAAAEAVAARWSSTKSRGARTSRSRKRTSTTRSRASRERTGRTPAAVRARLEKEGGIGRLYSGLRRERAIDFLLSRATIVQNVMQASPTPHEQRDQPGAHAIPAHSQRGASVDVHMAHTSAHRS